MKRILAALLAVLILPVLSAGEESMTPDSSAARFEGLWVDGDAQAEIVRDGSGFRATILKDGLLWRYWCLEQQDTGLLIDTGFGSLCEASAKSNGDVSIGDSLYDDGAATFSIDGEGRLIWSDEKENAGEGLAFVSAGRFAGSWADGGAFVRITLEGDSYVIYATVDTTPTPEWHYVCVFDPLTGTLDGVGSMDWLTQREEDGLTLRETVLVDIAVTFSVSDEGALIWEDETDRAGDWLNLTRTADAFGFPL